MFNSTAGFFLRFAIVPGERISAKTRCWSSHTVLSRHIAEGRENGFHFVACCGFGPARFRGGFGNERATCGIVGFTPGGKMSLANGVGEDARKDRANFAECVFVQGYVSAQCVLPCSRLEAE